MGWIGVDFDGTLVFMDEWRGPEHVGEPIMPMVERIRQWLSDGRDVRIFTARVAPSMPLGEAEICKHVIQKFCLEQFGRVLPVCCCKDHHMIELWDDRAVQMIPNTGRTLADATLAELTALEGK